MSVIRIYHGTTEINLIPSPDWSNSQTDFGPGFYCSFDSDSAKEWACRTYENGWVYGYDLDISGLNVLNLNESPYDVRYLVALLVTYRTEELDPFPSGRKYDSFMEEYWLDIAGYDAIIGYRPGDPYPEYINDYFSGKLSIEQLNKAIHLGAMGNQIALKTQKAFSRLTLVLKENVTREKYYPQYMLKKANAKNAYQNLSNGYLL